VRRCGRSRRRVGEKRRGRGRRGTSVRARIRAPMVAAVLNSGEEFDGLGAIFSRVSKGE
jgi:hypothetical protein